MKTTEPKAIHHHDDLEIPDRCEELGETVILHLAVRDLDDLRGALKPDAQGGSWRGDVSALRRLLDEEPAR